MFHTYLDHGSRLLLDLISSHNCLRETVEEFSDVQGNPDEKELAGLTTYLGKSLVRSKEKIKEEAGD